MIHYADKTFCTDAEQCASGETCFRAFDERDRRKAELIGLPVAIASFKMQCKFWCKKEATWKS